MSAKPLTLITNDDGIKAEGIRALINSLKHELDLFVVAPMNEKSGAGHSITLGKDIHLNEVEENVFAFDGTPVDCVAFALRNLVREKPDLCISGINLGVNLGNDTLCSGTVGAALAAANEGIPGIAISIDGREGPYHFETALHVLKILVRNRLKIFNRIHHKKILNVNIPNIPLNEFKGIKIAKLCERIWSAEFQPGRTPESFRYHHEDPINFGGPGFDVTAVVDGYASISVLSPSLFDEHSNDILMDINLEGLDGKM